MENRNYNSFRPRRQPPSPPPPPPPSFNDTNIITIATGNEILRRANEHIISSEIVCQESETIATDTLEELANQRESLTRTRGHLQNMNDNLSGTHTNLKSIHRKLATNKLLLMAIILFEIIIIACQLYLKFFKK